MTKFFEHKRERIVILVLILIFIIKLITISKYHNTDWEPDSFMHFLELRTVFTDFPHNLIIGLGVWSKPLYSYVIGLIVYIFNIRYLFSVEIINILIFLLISYLVYRIVYKLYSNFNLALFSLILTSFSFTLFKSSTSTLTDPIFTLMIILSTYFALNNKYILGSIFIGLSVLGRIEGLFFNVIYLIWLLFIIQKENSNQKRIKFIISNILIALVPVFIWNTLGFLTSGLFPYIIKAGYPSVSGQYGYGTWLHYPKQFLIYELPITLLFIFSTTFVIYLLFKNKEKILKDFKSFQTNIRSTKEYINLLMWGYSVLFIIIQVILWKYGAFGTAGLMRYFVSVIPVMIIFGCLILHEISFTIKSRLFNILLTAILIIQVLILLLYLTGFLVKKDFPILQSNLIDAGEWIKINIPQSTFVGSDRPEVLYYSDRDLNLSTIFFQNLLSRSQKGIYVWTGWTDIPQSDLINKANLLTIIDNNVYIYQI